MSAIGQVDAGINTAYDTSTNEVDGAEQKAAKYGNANRTLVLIDADKIEKMAEDEDYRKKYEDIIGNANSQLDQMKQSLGSMIGNVKTFGIKVDDGGNTSFFAVVDKSLSAQKERIAKKAETKRKEKTQDKKSEKISESDEVETIEASSIEDLMKKLTDRTMSSLSDQARTQQEMQIGTQVDFRL